MEPPAAARRRVASALGLAVGAALIVLGTVELLRWPLGPASWRAPLVAYVLLGAGVVVAAVGGIVHATARGRTAADPEDDHSAAGSLATLPAQLRESEPVVPSGPPRDEPAVPPAMEPAPPASSTPAAPAAPMATSIAVAAASPEPSPVPAPTPPAARPANVAELAGRIDTLQRLLAIPSASGGATPAVAGSPLTRRLTTVPAPPTTSGAPGVGRTCSACGVSLGDPPRYDPCAGCGCALCAACYWRASSGPATHRCPSCATSRPAAPAPAGAPRPAPALSVGGGGATPSVAPPAAGSRTRTRAP